MFNEAAKSLQVMIVDDQKAMRSIIRALMSQHDINNVTEAADGVDVMKNLLDCQRPNPDVSICDLHMENMDGMEFCNKVRLRKIEVIKAIPILILTGERDKMPLEVAKQVGATAVLGKPISAPDLCGHIESAVGFSFSN
jgi:two-component system chemotaxis response regulator CheY